MINLLPPQTSKQLRASQHNSILIGYLIGSGIVLGLILAVYVSIYILMKTTEINSLESSIENKQKIAQLKETEDKAREYATNLTTARTLFGNTLSYTAALHKIASALPRNVVLESLDLNPTTTTQPLTLSLAAKAPEAALAVKDMLEKANVATDITIVSLQNQPTGGAAASEYPVQISLNLTLNKTLFTADNKEVKK